MKKKLIVIGALGLFYYVWIQSTGISIPCPIRAGTGFLCPGCGITTMSVNLLHLRFKAAFFANPFLFVTAPLIAAEILYAMRKSEKKEPLPKWNRTLLIIYLICLLLFAVIRNIIIFS